MTLPVIIKCIDKKIGHYIVIAPFCDGQLTFEYYEDLFGIDNFNEFLTMLKNHRIPYEFNITRIGY